MVKEIKSGHLVVKSNQILINFADAVKSFHNVDLLGILRIGLVKWSEIGWGEILR